MSAQDSLARFEGGDKDVVELEREILRLSAAQSEMEIVFEQAHPLLNSVSPTL